MYAGQSKQLGHDDVSGFAFSRELLNGAPTAAINFDRLQKHPQYGYIIIEYLLCDEHQRVTPYTSHPNRYWNKNAMKFLSLWRAACDLKGTLYLVNYAKKGTHAEDEVLLIQVLDMDETGITLERKQRFTRQEFGAWFRRLNEACLTDQQDCLMEIYRQKDLDSLGKLVLREGECKNKTIEYVFDHDRPYLERMSGSQLTYAAAAACYLDRRG